MTKQKHENKFFVEAHRTKKKNYVQSHPVLATSSCLFALAIITGYTSLLIADISVFQHTSPAALSRENTNSNSKVPVWNCQGNYTQDPSGNAICIDVAATQKSDNQGNNYITSNNQEF